MNTELRWAQSVYVLRARANAFCACKRKMNVNGQRCQPSGGVGDAGQTRTGLTASEARATMNVWGGEGFDSVDGVPDPTARPTPVCVDGRTTKTGIWLCVSTFWA
jgi:hypothetical protein